MFVYVVTSICDSEYGCTTIEKIFSSYEKAEEYISNNGGNYIMKFWSGVERWYYSIETWEIDE